MVDKQSGKDLMLLKCLVALVLVTGISTTSLATVIYNVDRAVGPGMITGTIETNGAIGALTSADIIDWNLTIDADGDPTTSGQLLGPISGNNSSITFLTGSPLTATPTELFFDFSLPDGIIQIATPGDDVVWQLQAGVFSDELIREALLPGPIVIQEIVTHPPVQQQVATTGAAHVPVTYSFITGNAPFGNPTLLPSFSGLSVTGTFDYDPDVAAVGTVPGGSPAGGSTIYPGAITNLSGSVGALSFSDPFGIGIVGNDEFELTIPPSDILLFSADINGLNLNGFDIAGFSLVDVRMFWIENLLPITDFLSDQNLPGVLPSLQGRLAFDFTPTSNPGQLSSVFFDGFMVIQLPMISEVGIDIKPGSLPNSINPRSKGKIPVAILTTNMADGDPLDFDATQIDPLSVEFGPDGATEAHGRGHVEDVDGDGDMDLVLHFKNQQTGISCGDTEASVTGVTFSGDAIEGIDSINTVGC